MAAAIIVSSWMQNQPESQPRTIPETYWERVADKLDCVLQGCSNYWPQYDAERLRVFARALDEVRDQTELEGITQEGVS